MGNRLPKDRTHEISLDEAAKLTRRQRMDKNLRTKGMESPYAFRREVLERILSQPNCDAIRFYPALHEDGTPTIVIVGIDTDGNDMVQGELGEDLLVCPPFCPDPNPLTDG